MSAYKRIPMNSISALSLHADRLTTSRRVSPVRQLTCKGNLCRKYQPPVISCIPIGSSGGTDVEWKCEADLPTGIRLGSVEVSCEGWDDSSDPYILKGSCGLTYNLVKGASGFEDSQYSLPDSSSSTSWFSLLVIAILVYAIWNSFRHRLPAMPTLNDARRWGGGGWGGGPGGWGGGGGGPGFGGGPPPPYSSKPDDATWRPGFWTGLATGAAALQGANMLRGDGARARGRYYDDDDRGVGGSGTWGRGGGGSGGRETTQATTPSTGFGGTRNR